MIAVAGLDPFVFLNEKDPFLRSLTQALAQRILDVNEGLDLSRAAMIANAVGKLFKA